MTGDQRAAAEAEPSDEGLAAAADPDSALARTLAWLGPTDGGTVVSLAVKALAKDLARDTAEPIMDRRLRGLVRVDSYRRYLSLLGVCEQQRARQRRQARLRWALAGLCTVLSLALPAVALLV